MYILIIVAVVVVLLAIIRPDLLSAAVNGLARATSEIWSYLAPILPYYIWGTLIAIGLIALFVVLGVIINSPAITGICFLLAIALFYLVFLVPGLFFRLIRVNRSVFPPVVKTGAAWLAVLGFLGMFSPEALSFNFLLGVSLLAFVALGIATKIDFLTKVAYPLVLVMCCIVVWKFVAPENFRATTRHFYARNAQVNSWNDRRSIEAEADALVTYARLNRSISVVYTATIEKNEDGVEFISAMKDKKDSVSENTLVKVYNHKTNVMQYEGQGFVMIQIAKVNGSFVNASKYWIEADYLTILSPGDLAEERRIAAEQKQRAAYISTQPQIQPQPKLGAPAVYSNVGSYPLNIGKGESVTFIIDDCHSYRFSHNQLVITPKGRRSMNAWELAAYPQGVREVTITNLSDKPLDLIITA